MSRRKGRDEKLLRQLLPGAPKPARWEWLRDLPFVLLVSALTLCVMVRLRLQRIWRRH